MKIGHNLGLSIEEREVRLEELFQAEEAFITNSLLEIMPLREINGRILGKGRRGETTLKLRSAYKEAVSKEST